MAIGFQSFKGAQQAATPSLADATARQGEMENAAALIGHQRRNANRAGAINAYDKFTGKDTPIRDYLSEALRGTDNPMEANAVPVEDKSIYSDGAGNITGEAGLDQYDSMDNLNVPEATDLPLGFDTATGAVDPALQAGDLSAALREGGDAAGGFDASGVPIISALSGVNQLANGDIAGASGTALKAGLSTLGPWGALAGLGLGLTGLV